MTRHFFLIDDDEDELEIFMEAMSKLNFPCKCTYAQNAEQALNILNYLVPDVVFVDINMPQMNGFECIKKIRNIPDHENTCLVLYSSELSEESYEKSKSAGANYCIKKTDSVEILAQAMEELIMTSAAPAQSR